MISILSSGSPKEDYILECLRDVGLRTFSDSVEPSSEDIRPKLLLVTKENLTDTEVLMVREFLEKKGDVLVFSPCPQLFGTMGEWDSIEGLSGTTPNDFFSVHSTAIPIYEPISSTEDGEVIVRTANSKRPVLVSLKSTNSIHFFSFSVSRNLFKIRQGCFGESYLAERKQLGGFAHKELNPLEMSNGPLHETPCVDVLAYFVLERILTSLKERGIILPFLWNVPDSKDASVLMTMDEDWANPVVTEDALGLFRRESVPLTFFLTTPLVDHDDLPGDDAVEYSIHPFHKDDIFSKETLEEGMRFLPRPPTGFRNHRRLVENPEMYVSAKELGFEWNSNLGVSNSSGYATGTGVPLRIVQGTKTFDILEFPINFEDDVHFTTCHDLGFDGTHVQGILEMNMESFHSFFVFGFHPIHVFLNSSSAKEYESAKKEGVLEDPKSLMTFRKPLLEKEGTRTLLLGILEFINSNRSRLHVGTVGEINKFWRSRAKTRIRPTTKGFTISPVFEGLGIALPFLGVGDVEGKIHSSSARDVRVADVHCTLVEPPREAPTKGSWDLPYLGQANP